MYQPVQSRNSISQSLIAMRMLVILIFSFALACVAAAQMSPPNRKGRSAGQFSQPHGSSQPHEHGSRQASEHRQTNDRKQTKERKQTNERKHRKCIALFVVRPVFEYQQLKPFEIEKLVHSFIFTIETV